MQGDEFSQQAIETILRRLALQGRLGSSRTFRTPPLVAAIGVGADSPAQVVRFAKERGYALALYGQESTATPLGAAGLEMRVQVGGSRDLFLDGQGAGAFMPQLALVGGLNNWYPLYVETDPAIPWVVTFRNLTGAPNTPMAAFSWVSRAELLAQLREA